MQTLGLIALVLKHLPQILRLIELLEQAEKEAKIQGKVKADLETINRAFEAKDAAALKKLFNS